MLRSSSWIMCFNPCFSGMAFGTTSWMTQPFFLQTVSILVFLEWPLGRPTSGWFAMTIIPVSILVFLEWPLGPGVAATGYVGVSKFQSLFFWNGLWDQRRQFDHCDPWRVSILVFLEWPLGRCVHPGRHVVNKFQSLFFWNGLWDTTGTFSMSDCITVSILVFLEWPLGHGRRTRPIQGGQQVSILVFLEWPLGHQRYPRNRHHYHVSILVFLEWPLGRLSVAGLNSMTKFQSLFFWNGLWDAAYYGGNGRGAKVSILVFLEWPLGPASASRA